MFVTYGPRAGGQWLAQNAPFLMILRSAYPDFSLPGQIDGGSEWVKQSTVGRPVIDRTGLTGRWDIELEYSITTTPSTAADQANAPTSVFTAVQEQLGLRLESQKEKLEVLVIDQIELPTAN